MKQTVLFFGGFTQFVVPVFASRQSLCTWHRYLEKTSVMASFFWLQGPLMQSSAAPQGSPPPTQNSTNKNPNANKLSWVINYPIYVLCVSSYLWTVPRQIKFWAILIKIWDWRDPPPRWDKIPSLAEIFFGWLP